MNPHDPALIRFVTAGLLATVDAYLSGGLPLPRLARELAARTDTLAELRPPARTLTRLRWLHRDVSRLDAELRDAGRTGPDPDQRDRLNATLDAVRAAAATLLPRAEPPTEPRAEPPTEPRVEPGAAAVHEWVTDHPGFGYRMG
jgi:hypothetical protein